LIEPQSKSIVDIGSKNWGRRRRRRRPLSVNSLAFPTNNIQTPHHPSRSHTLTGERSNTLLLRATERASPLANAIFRKNITSKRIPPPAPLLSYLNPFVSFFGGKERRPAAVEDDDKKTHAIIANAATMHLLPGSLRHLTKCAKEADVPVRAARPS